MLVIGLVFGAGLGFTIAAANGITLGGHDHGAHGHGDAQAGHDHTKMLSLPAGADSPTLSVHAMPDPMTGWNLHFMTENFTFAPEHASGANVPGEGHAHVYVNGVKLGRFYGPWVHLDHLPEGEVSVQVTLNANDHSPLAVEDVPVAETVTIRN